MGLLAEFNRRISGLWEGVKANLLFPRVGEINVLMCRAPQVFKKSWTPLCPVINNQRTPRGAKSISWARCWCRCGELLLEVGLGDKNCSLMPCLRFLLSSQHGCSGLCSLTATYPSSFNIFAVLQFVKCLVWKTCEQCVSIIQLRCNESMNDSLAPSWDSPGCSFTYYALQM